MLRRKFATLAALTALGGLTDASLAQSTSGSRYVRLSQRQPTLDPNRIEVLEFFSYGCPACFAFEPALDAWARKLPADVQFRRIPVAFREVPFVLHQKLYFALETMGLVDRLHRQVFAAIHVERNPLDTPDRILDFVARNGVDRGKFGELMNSFGIAARARQAAQLSAGYGIDGTPALGIDGQFFTSGVLAGGHQGSLHVADELIGQIRARGK